jgi:hypothetical protein
MSARVYVLHCSLLLHSKPACLLLLLLLPSKPCLLFDHTVLQQSFSSSSCTKGIAALIIAACANAQEQFLFHW